MSLNTNGATPLIKTLCSGGWNRGGSLQYYTLSLAVLVRVHFPTRAPHVQKGCPSHLIQEPKPQIVDGLGLPLWEGRVEADGVGFEDPKRERDQHGIGTEYAGAPILIGGGINLHACKQWWRECRRAGKGLLKVQPKARKEVPLSEKNSTPGKERLYSVLNMVERGILQLPSPFE